MSKVLGLLLSGFVVTLLSAWGLMFWYGAAAVNNGWPTISYWTTFLLCWAFSNMASPVLYSHAKQAKESA